MRITKKTQRTPRPLLSINSTNECAQNLIPLHDWPFFRGLESAEREGCLRASLFRVTGGRADVYLSLFLSSVIFKTSCLHSDCQPPLLRRPREPSRWCRWQLPSMPLRRSKQTQHDRNEEPPGFLVSVIFKTFFSQLGYRVVRMSMCLLLLNGTHLFFHETLI